MIGQDFATVLQAHLRTSMRAGVPALAMRLLLGELVQELLPNGQRVLPQQLRAAGFYYPSIAIVLMAIYSD